MYNGILASRYLKSVYHGRGDGKQASAYARSRADWGSDREIVADHFKASVGAITTTGVEGISTVGADFLASVRPLTVLGRLLGIRKVPARIPLLTQIAPGTAAWVSEGRAVPMAVGTFHKDSIELKGVAALTVVTNEAMDEPSFASGEAWLDLLAACAEAVDLALLDTNYTTDLQAPQSIVTTATPVTAGAATIAGLDAALQEAVERLVAAGSNLKFAQWVMGPQLATAMSLARGTSGAPAYPGMNLPEPRLATLPVLVSGAMTYDSDGGPIALVDGAQLAYAEGEPTLRTSQDAMIEMSTAPTGDIIVPTAASSFRVSMFDCDSTAVMAKLRVNWFVRRAGAVQLILGAAL